MDGQMDRQIDRWIDRWMDEWIDRQMNGWMDGWIDRYMQMDRRSHFNLDLDLIFELVDEDEEDEGADICEEHTFECSSS